MAEGGCKRVAGRSGVSTRTARPFPV